MKWLLGLIIGLCALTAAYLGVGVVAFEWFNEAVLRPTAVVFAFGMQVARALYYGLRAGAAAAGADPLFSSVIAGLILTAVLAGLIWLVVWIARKFRVKEPGLFAIWTGTILFWLGYAMGFYFFGLAVYLYMATQLDGSPSGSRLVGFLTGTAILYPALGRGIRYMLGR